MLVSEYIAQFIAQKGITTVFGYQGGNISYTIDAICRAGLQFIETYNEQGAAFAANTYAEATDGVGVSVASSGPGAINMLNGIANAYCDSIPCLYITGDVNSSFRNKYEGVRQNDFQDIDIISMARPITKAAFQIEHENDIIEIMPRAFEIMLNGRKGPVLINVAHNIQKADIAIDEVPFSINKKEMEYERYGAEKKITDKLKGSKDPIILLGNGARNSKSELERFIESTQLPFTCTLKALDILPDNANFLGLAGNYGTTEAKKRLNDADCILVLGARLDVRVISAIEMFAEKTVVHVDIDKAELAKHHSKDYTRICQPVECIRFSDINYKHENRKDIITNKQTPSANLSFCSFFSQFTSPFPSSYNVDVGLHQMATARFLKLRCGDRIYNSGGLGSMGFAIPSSIGCYFADKTKTNIVFTGDGGFQMNIQELEVIRREAIPIKIFVLNNNCLGMIRNYQDYALSKRHFATVEGFSTPNLSKIATAYEMDFASIKSLDDMDRLPEILSSTKPTLVEVIIPINDNID